MAYGFLNHLENKGYSKETVQSYEKVLNQFFIFIKTTYPDNKEPFQISSRDIKSYLELQKEKDKSLSTINKELAILKTFFNYLWEINKVPIDPAVKIKRYDTKEKPTIDFPFDELKSLLDKVLKNHDYPPVRKAIFLLATKGMKTAEFRFKRDCVMEYPENEKIVIKLHNRNIQLEGKEASYFQEYFYESMFNGSDYVFLTKKHGEEIGGPIEVMSILNHLRAIAKDYLGEDKTITLVSIRRAIAFDLYTKQIPIQQIAKTMGIEEESASNYLKKLMGGKAAQITTWMSKDY